MLGAMARSSATPRTDVLAATLLAVACTVCAHAETHVVEGYDMVFVPVDVYVQPGDIIRWEYVSGSPHTITTGENCVLDGYLNAPLSIVDQVFEWVVPEDVPAVLPYFCAPHCINGMVGTIRLGEPCPADLSGDGGIGVDDLLQIIAQWGQAGGSADIDMNGTVDVDDLLAVISGWGPCP